MLQKEENEFYYIFKKVSKEKCNKHKENPPIFFSFPTDFHSKSHGDRCSSRHSLLTPSVSYLGQHCIAGNLTVVEILVSKDIIDHVARDMTPPSD
jgi:hypothetical protein